MRSTTIQKVVSKKKKAYTAPQLKVLGNVKKLTLKSGSAVDGFGTFG